MDWWQCVDLRLLLFATASFSAPSSLLPHRLVDFLHSPRFDGHSTQRTDNGGYIRWWPHCERLWLVWKRLKIASNYTMKPGFLLTFLLAGSTIVHACECLQFISLLNYIHSFSFRFHDLDSICSLLLVSVFFFEIGEGRWLLLFISKSIDANRLSLEVLCAMR